MGWRRQWRWKAQGWLLPLAVLALWALAAQRQWMSPQVLPAPGLVWQSARELAATDLWPNLWISLQRVFYGLALGVSAGLALGVWLGTSRRAFDVVYPTFHALAQVPTLIWLPLFMLWFGIGEALKLAMVVKAVLLPVTLHTIAGVRDTPPALREVAQVLRLGRWQTLCRLLPAALPSFATGLRLALAQAWIALLAVELLASSEGIGYLMVWGRQLFQLDIVFVCIVVIGLVGMAMDRSLEWADRRLLRWPRPAVAQLPSPPRRRWQRLRPWWLPLVLLAAWWLASARGWASTDFLVPPRQLLATLVAGVADGSLPEALAHSLRRTLLGLLLGAVSGLLTGLALGLCRPLGRLVAPSLAALRQVAIFAWVPLITAWVGLDEAAKIVFVALAAFFPIYVATYRGIADLPAPLVEAARVLRLGVWPRLRLLVLPGAAASIFAGLRLALIFAWLGTIGAEYFMASGTGIGSLMIGAQQLFRLDIVLSGMILTSATGALLGAAGQWIETRATRWRLQDTRA